jgi:hypothetical protein
MMGHRFPLCRFVIDYFALLQPLRQYLTRRFVLVLVLVVVLESGHAERCRLSLEAKVFLRFGLASR